MAGVEDEGLTVRHGGEVLQHQPELSPVGEDLTVTAVGDELLGELRHPGVQVVQQHVQDGGSVSRPGSERGNEYQSSTVFQYISLPCRDLVNGNGVKRLVRHEPVHVDMPELSQLPSELLGQDGV